MRFSTRLSAAACAAVLAVAALVPAAAAQTADANLSASPGPSSSPAAVFDGAGVLHVAWADEPGSDALFPTDVYYARSLDGGASFEAPRRVSGGPAAGRRAYDVRVALGPGGAVWVAWWGAVRQDGVSLEGAFLARSGDGGASFAPASATGLAFRVGDFAAKEGFAFLPSLALAVGADGAAHLLATVQDYRFGYNVFYARVGADGATGEAVKLSRYTAPIPRAARSALAVGGADRVLAAWTESHGDFIDEIKEVYSATSSNGGRTFGAPSRVQGAKGVAAAATPAGDGLGLLVALQNKPRRSVKINFLLSADGGSSFRRKAPVGVMTADGYLTQPALAASGGTVAVAWVENSQRTGPEKGLYVGVSRDGGRTFGAPALALAGLFPEPPAVAVAPDGSVGIVYVSGEGSLAARDVYFRRVAP